MFVEPASVTREITNVSQKVKGADLSVSSSILFTGKGLAAESRGEDRAG